MVIAPGPRLERLFLATFALFGFQLGSSPIGDNSTFLHVRTGELIASTWSIPRRDIYSFTAPGVRWTVQSWLPEWIYGWAYRLGGFEAVVFENALLMAAVGLSVAVCARAGSPLRTAAAAGIAVAIGAPYWSPRPLLFGILGLALTVLIFERRWNRWWLVPVVWFWVSSHGSFPLGLAWLGLVALGAALDSPRSWREGCRDPVHYLAAFAVGLLVACANPLGPRLLLFAAEAGEKREIFARIIEWQSPDFHQTGPLFSLVFLTVALGVMFRKRLAWRDLLPVCVFVAASLFAARNLVMVAVIVAPVLGRALAAPLDQEPRPPLPSIERALTGVLMAVAVLFAANTATSPPLDLRGYPVKATRFLADQGWLQDGHLAHDDVAGGYLILRDGPRARVFYDDRFDMYPLAVSRDVVNLEDGTGGALAILDRRKIETVLWPSTRPLSALLTASSDWKQVFSAQGWKVFRRA